MVGFVTSTSGANRMCPVSFLSFIQTAFSRPTLAASTLSGTKETEGGGGFEQNEGR